MPALETWTKELTAVPLGAPFAVVLRANGLLLKTPPFTVVNNTLKGPNTFHSLYGLGRHSETVHGSSP